MTDDQLLERLGAALVPVAASSGPPATSLQDLHRAIDATTRTGAKAQPRRPGPRVLTVAALVAAACVAIVMVATSLPRIGRETSTRISVTATSPALGEVTDRRRALETALADGHTPAVAVAAARLRVALNDLATSEWIPIRAEVEDLLRRADALLERSGRGGNEDSPGGSSNASSTTKPGVSAVVSQPTTSVPAQATSPAAPPPTVPATTGATAISPSVTAQNAVGDLDEDNVDGNSGPGGGGPGDDNSGPGGGGPGDDNSGPGSD